MFLKNRYNGFVKFRFDDRSVIIHACAIYNFMDYIDVTTWAEALEGIRRYIAGNQYFSFSYESVTISEFDLYKTGQTYRVFMFHETGCASCYFNLTEKRIDRFGATLYFVSCSVPRLKGTWQEFPQDIIKHE